eukprot:TRINITY_DN1137_c2_g1_i1.p1 TRINITY_DN1137_c2_g1~~TRINITY_DN1137_c2_g1_i1.p1  ORF type:complete len:890 (+),score=223.00 TRINITY_DN1137_c2_g1_i1:146-2671(+)
MSDGGERVDRRLRSLSVLSASLTRQVQAQLEPPPRRSPLLLACAGLGALQLIAVLLQFVLAIVIGDDNGLFIGLCAGAVVSLLAVGLLLEFGSAVVADIARVDERVVAMTRQRREDELPDAPPKTRFREAEMLLRSVLVASARLLQYQRIAPSGMDASGMRGGMPFAQEGGDQADEETDEDDSEADMLEAPEGEVTIVFTDIQSSTRLWEQCSDAMNEALSTHNSAIRKRLRQCYGYEVKTIGDAFMCAFASPFNAVKFALGVQEELVNRSWPKQLELCDAAAVEYFPDGSPLWYGLRVRIGAHTGPAILEHNPLTERADYRGPTVNKAARVEAQGQGGMVMVTKELFRAVEPRMGELGSPFTHDVGERSLKGVKEPVHLQLLIPARLSERFKAWGEKPAQPEERKKRGGRRQSNAAGGAKKMIMTPFGAIEAPDDDAGPGREASLDASDLQAFGLAEDGKEKDGKEKRGAKATPKQGWANGPGKEKGGKKPAAMLGALRRQSASIAYLRVATQHVPVGGDVVFMQPGDVHDIAVDLLRCATMDGHGTRGVIEGNSGDSMLVSWNVSLDNPLHGTQSLRFAALTGAHAPPNITCGVSTGLVMFGQSGTESHQLRLAVGKVVMSAGALSVSAAGMGTFCLTIEHGEPVVSAYGALRRYLRPADSWCDDDGTILTVNDVDIDALLDAEEDGGIWDAHLDADRRQSALAASQSMTAVTATALTARSEQVNSPAAVSPEADSSRRSTHKTGVQRSASYADTYRAALAGSAPALQTLRGMAGSAPQDYLLHKVCYNLEQHQDAGYGARLWRVYAPWAYGMTQQSAESRQVSAAVLGDDQTPALPCL